jgi:AraC-like DNA-binding protein
MLSRFRLFSSVDVDAFRAQARKDNPGIVSLDQDEAGPFHSDIASYQFRRDGARPGLYAVSHTTGLRLEAHSRDAVRLLVPCTGRISMAIGSRLREIHGGVAGLAAADAQRIRYSAGQHVTVRADPARIAAAMWDFDCDAEIEPLLNELFFEPRLAGLQDVAAQARQLIAIIDESPSEIVDLSAFRAAHDQLLVLRLAHVLVLAADPRRRRLVGCNGAALRRAEDYIRAHAEQHVDLVAMARCAGLSLRSLQILFRGNFDCTIVQYIRRHRLTLARERLERSEPRTSIAEVARLSGFTHLGHFARAYKATFGELPRQSIQRARSRSAWQVDPPPPEPHCLVSTPSRT